MVAMVLFAPGHLGELTQIVPFEMVGEALEETGAVQQRLRKIPARVVVYLLLAAALFEDCGYLAVWPKLTAALKAIPVAKITGTALWDARARLGVTIAPRVPGGDRSSHAAGTQRPISRCGRSSHYLRIVTREVPGHARHVDGASVYADQELDGTDQELRPVAVGSAHHHGPGVRVG